MIILSKKPTADPSALEIKCNSSWITSDGGGFIWFPSLSKPNKPLASGFQISWANLSTVEIIKDGFFS